jgi:hypothetical protein
MFLLHLLHKNIEIMETTFLVSNRFKSFGWILMIIATVLWIIFNNFEFDQILSGTTLTIYGNDLFTNNAFFNLVYVNLEATIAGVLFIIGGMFVAFAKQKTEDEFIMNLRLLSFQWAVLLNYTLLLFCFIFFYSQEFFTVMIYNMFTVLILFIIRFHYLLNKYNDASNDK